MRKSASARIVTTLCASILLTMAPGIAAANDRPRIVLEARLCAEHAATDVVKTVREFAADCGWRVSSKGRGPNGARGTVVSFRALRDGRHHDLVIDRSGLVRGDFSTADGGALLHARIVRLVDRLDPLLATVRVTDSTGYFDARDGTALRDRFVAFHVFRRALIADAFRRGEDIVIDGRLYSEVPETARDAFDAAEAFVRRGRLAEAEKALDVAIGLYGDHARALILRAQVLAETGKVELALRDATRAITIKPGMAMGYLVRAKIAVGNKKPADALDDLDRALEVEPNHVESLLLRGLVHLEGGRGTPALRDLEAAARPLTRRPFAADARYPGGVDRRSASTVLGALVECYRAARRFDDADRTEALLEKLRPRTARDRVVLDRKSRLVLERPTGWRLEEAPGDPRILVRMRETKSDNACRIAIMKQWGRVTDPDFKATFDRSVLQGLAQLGNSPRLLKGFRQRTGGFEVYQILVENRERQYCWIACLNHGGKMLTVYLTSKQPPGQSRAALQKVLEGITAPREAP